MGERLDCSPTSVRRRLRRAESDLSCQLRAISGDDLGSIALAVAFFPSDPARHAIWSWLRRASHVLRRGIPHTKWAGVVSVVALCAVAVLAPAVARGVREGASFKDLAMPLAPSGSNSSSVPSGTALADAGTPPQPPVGKGENTASGLHAPATIATRSRPSRKASKKPSQKELRKSWPRTISTLGTSLGLLHVSPSSQVGDTSLVFAWQEQLLAALPVGETLTTVWEPEQTGSGCITERLPDEGPLSFHRRHAIAVIGILLDRLEAMRKTTDS